jgi:hypothetical protein
LPHKKPVSRTPLPFFDMQEELSDTFPRVIDIHAKQNQARQRATENEVERQLGAIKRELDKAANDHTINEIHLPMPLDPMVLDRIGAVLRPAGYTVTAVTDCVSGDSGPGGEPCSYTRTRMSISWPPL